MNKYLPCRAWVCMMWLRYSVAGKESPLPSSITSAPWSDTCTQQAHSVNTKTTRCSCIVGYHETYDIQQQTTAFLIFVSTPLPQTPHLIPLLIHVFHRGRARWRKSVSTWVEDKRSMRLTLFLAFSSSWLEADITVQINATYFWRLYPCRVAMLLQQAKDYCTFAENKQSNICELALKS